jgi:tetrapyrrole methylase family protein/MazG family protein
VQQAWIDTIIFGTEERHLPTIHVVGLGPGGLDGLPLGSYKLLESGLPVFLRTEIHPVVADIRHRGVSYVSFDDLYQTGESFEEIYMQMANTLVEEAKRHGEIVYAVPGHPLMAEKSVQNLYEIAGDVEIHVGPGQSFLDSVCTVLKLDPIEGMLLLDGTDLKAEQLQATLHTLIAQVFHPRVASDVKLTLMEVYPDDYPVTVVRAAGVKGEERIETVPLYDLDRLDFIDHLTTVFVPAVRDDRIRYKDPWFVVDLVRRLRDPDDGCPWDRKQTHQSLRKYVIEEAYEVAHAIDMDDMDALTDELGDLLLQIVLHAQIGSEFGEFTIRDVYSALSDKLIRRHPHVFGEKRANSTEEAQMMWEKAKAQEQKGDNASQHVSRLIKWGQAPIRVAFDVQTSAAEVGFDWTSIEGVLEKVREELSELEREIAANSKEGIVDELGDLAFSIVNLSRWCQVDFEEALLAAVRKFHARFAEVERKVISSGRSWSDFSLAELEALWLEAKKQGNHAF